MHQSIPIARLGVAALVLGVFLVSELAQAQDASETAMQAQKAAEIAAERTSAWLVFAASVFGVVVTAAVTLVGWWSKRAFDRRTAALKENAEKRLRLDTFISAVPLLEAAPGRRQQANADRSVQAVSVLFVLVELGHSDFALNLLGGLWPDRISSSEQFVWVIDRVMRKGSDEVREHAVRMLFDNAESLAVPDTEDFCWPTFLDNGGWNLSLSEDARELLVLTLMRVAQARAADEWHPQSLLDLLAGMEVAAVKDPVESVSGLAARASLAICEVLLRIGDCELLLPRGSRVTISGLCQKMKTKADAVGRNNMSDQGRGELEALDIWKTGGVVERSGQTTMLGVINGDEESEEEIGEKFIEEKRVEEVCEKKGGEEEVS